jgi:hypothetical protein
MTEITAIFGNENPNWMDDSEYSRLFLRSQQNWANDLLRARGHVFLNEIHDMLGLPRTTQGQLEGWLHNDSAEGDQIDFGCWDQTSDTGAIQLKFNTTGVIHDKIES